MPWSSAQRGPTHHGLTALRGLACCARLATKQKAKLELRSGLALWSWDALLPLLLASVVFDEIWD